MYALTLASPAKLNLALRVIKKRPDGYHELSTLFHRISLRDTLYLRKQDEGIRLVCFHPKVPLRNNLIVKAFALLKKKYPFQGGVTVHLTKRIPVGGGLGGGSSNAAHFLMGMNRLFRLGLKQAQLLELGKWLGADVPFFLHNVRHAIGRGRGERIEPLPFRRRLWFLLLTHAKGVSTRRVYQLFKPPKQTASLTRLSHDARIASAFLEKGSLAKASMFLQNDLTASAERVRSSLKKTRESLSGLQLGTCQMSGSGPTLFFIFLSKQKALQALRKIKRHGLFKSSVVCHSF